MSVAAKSPEATTRCWSNDVSFKATQPVTSDHEATIAVERHLFGDAWRAVRSRLENHRRLCRVCQLIESRYDDQDLTLEQAADACAISKNYLNVLLLRFTANTFHALVTRYRLMRAADLLCGTDYSVLEISLECGFGSVSSFERNAKKVFGSPPTELRKLLLGRFPPAAGRILPV